MAVTIPATWSYQAEAEIAPDRPICTTGADDLATLAQRLQRAMANTTRIIASGGVGPGRTLSEAGVTTYTDRYHGAAHVWRTGTRCRLVVWGQRVTVLATLGGQPLAAVTCGATLGWEPGATLDLAGITITNGCAEIVVSAKQAATSGTRAWGQWAIEEMPMGSLPSESSSAFVGLDDGATVPDSPLDGFLLERLARNADELTRLRTRGTAIVWPLAEPVTFSSAWWRSDGPYILQADPWSDRASVAVRVEAYDDGNALGVEVCAFSEWETYAIATARAITVPGGTVATLVFDGLLCHASDGHTENRFWVGIRGAIGAAVAYSPVGSQPSVWGSGLRIVQVVDAGTGLCATEPVDLAVGRMVVGETARIGISAEAVGGLSASPEYAERDLAAVLCRPAGLLGDILLGANNGAQHGWHQASLSVFTVGIAQIHSVSLVGQRHAPALAAADLWAAASVGLAPPWSVVAAAVQVANQFARWATPQLSIRHRGGQWLCGTTTSASHTYYQRGRYGFATGYGPNVLESIPWPSSGLAGGGLNPDRVRATVVYLLLGTGGAHPEVTLTWDLHDGSSVLGSTVIAEPCDAIAAETAYASVWDASLAAASFGEDVNNVYEHNYVQQLGHLDNREEFGGRALWRTVEITGSFPAAFPAAIALRVSSDHAGVWVVLVGLGVDVQQRG
jgi:hypothetical protein